MEQLILVAMTGVQHNFLMRNYSIVKNSPMELRSMVAEQQLSPVSPHWEMTNILVIAKLLIQNKKQTHSKRLRFR